MLLSEKIILASWRFAQFYFEYAPFSSSAGIILFWVYCRVVTGADLCIFAAGRDRCTRRWKLFCHATPGPEFCRSRAQRPRLFVLQKAARNSCPNRGSWSNPQPILIITVIHVRNPALLKTLFYDDELTIKQIHLVLPFQASPLNLELSSGARWQA